MPLPAGKLPPELLNDLLKSLPSHPSVLVGAQVGEDAAIIDNGGAELLVAKTDPITFATDDLGHYLLAVNGNDLATMGAEPRWLLVTALLPEGIEDSEVRRIFDSVRDACSEAGIALVGGHTEITIGLDRPILVGCLLGAAPRDRIIRTSGAQPGDAVILTGGIAIEGAAILAREHVAELRDRGVPEEAIQTAAGWLRKPGISVLPAARILRDCETIHSMHDPTEGGLATALRELAGAAKVGLGIDAEAIPVLEECRIICSALRLDPLGLLASGSLLATLSDGETPAVFCRLREAGIPATRIGTVLPSGGVDAPEFDRDELARFLER